MKAIKFSGIICLAIAAGWCFVLCAHADETSGEAAKEIATVASTTAALTPQLIAQDMSSKVQTLTLAPSTADSASAAKDETNQQAELARKLQNPVADLISAPIQNNWDFGIGPSDAMQYTANIQPVIPFHLNQDWILITRTILPVIYREPLDTHAGAPASVSQSHAGLGDTTQSFFLSPKDPWHGWILGAGPVGYYPTATESELGGGKWGAGPTIVALRQEHGFTHGMLANQIWSFAGQQERPNINKSFLQPFLSFTTKTYTTFTVNTESTRDWQAEQWTVPVNFEVQQLVKIGGHPVAFQAG